jgi:hypothetical protein
MINRRPFLVIALTLGLAEAKAQDFTLIGLSEGKEPSNTDGIPLPTSLRRLTLEGCLARGNEAHPFLLTEKNTGKAVTVVGTSELEQHLGHLVRVRGARSVDDRYFHATYVETLADSCGGNELLHTAG